MEGSGFVLQCIEDVITYEVLDIQASSCVELTEKYWKTLNQLLKNEAKCSEWWILAHKKPVVDK